MSDIDTNDEAPATPTLQELEADLNATTEAVHEAETTRRKAYDHLRRSLDDLDKRRAEFLAEFPKVSPHEAVKAIANAGLVERQAMVDAGLDPTLPRRRPGEPASKLDGYRQAIPHGVNSGNVRGHAPFGQRLQRGGTFIPPKK